MGHGACLGNSLSEERKGVAPTINAFPPEDKRPCGAAGSASNLAALAPLASEDMFNTIPQPSGGKRELDRKADPLKLLFASPSFRKGQSASPLSVGCGVSRRTGRRW